MKKSNQPINNATITAYATGEERAQLFIRHFHYYALAEGEFLEFLAHYMKREPDEATSHMLGSLVLGQIELMRGTA